jgi:hypothetical protein
VRFSAYLKVFAVGEKKFWKTVGEWVKNWEAKLLSLHCTYCVSTDNVSALICEISYSV